MVMRVRRQAGGEVEHTVGKASRQRRHQRERERARERPRRDQDAHAGPSAQEELVVELVTGALRELASGDRAGYTRQLDQLTAERVPGWARAVSHCLVDFMRTAVSGAWEIGWQPAELARHCGREAGTAHSAMVADMIADESRRYAPASIDPRWAEQVAGLRAVSFCHGENSGAWWGADAGYLSAWRAAAREADPTAAAGTAIETLRVLLHLPAMEKLLPLPGTARAAAGAGGPARGADGASDATADERMLSRIRALLAKAESTEFAEEAEALSARAQELMAKYSIDHALLAARAGEKEIASGRRIAVDNPYESPKTTLLNVIAEANRCRAIWARDVGLVTVVGFPPDLDAVELLFTSLLVQADTAMLRAGGKRDEVGRSRTRAFRQSFLVSYAIRIGERLAEATTHAEHAAMAEQEAGAAAEGAAAPATGTDLVPFLAARREAVDDTVDELFGGRLTRGRSARVTDAEGWASGRAAADMASLLGRGAVAG
jgi:hypothetical protein